MEKKSIPFRRGRSNFSKSAKEDHSRVSQSHGVAGVEHTLLRLVHKRCRPQLLQLDVRAHMLGFRCGMMRRVC